MTDLQIQIKSILESLFEEITGEKILVEYVANVDEKVKEIQKQIGVTMHNVYEAIHYTGSFLPATENSCCYIIIQEDRKDNLDIMTAFHEIQHALEYTMFLNCIYNKNRQQMIDSKMYQTFQIYSEYSATRTGISNYLKYVQHSDMSQKEFANCVFNKYRKNTIWRGSYVS